MIFAGILIAYLIVRYYIKNSIDYLMYINLALLVLSSTILTIGGIESASFFGQYSMFFLILMFVEVSISFIKK